MKTVLLSLVLFTITLFSQIQKNNFTNKTSDLYSGQVAFYPFNGDASDESGNANNPTYIGTGVTLATDRFGNSDKAYYFDGNDGSYISIPADNFPTTDRTISFWFNADQVDNHPTPLSYGGETCNNSLLMIINKGDYPNAYTVLSHCGSNFISAPYSAAPVNSWYYLTMTISGTTQKIFINGELLQTENSFNSPTFVAGKSVIFGALLFTDGNTVYVDPTAGNFQGKLDDFRFYDHAFSDVQVLQLYNNESTGLVAYFPFNGNVNDSSGNANDGINYNGQFVKDRYGNNEGAIYFDGVDSYVVGTNAGNNLPIGDSPRTICTWIKSSEAASDRNIFHYGTAEIAPTNYHLFMHEGKYVGVGNGYGYGTLISNKDIGDDTWNFITSVYEGNGTNLQHIYINGKLDTSAVISNTPNTALITNWKIGQFMESTPSYLGNIDELLVYNTALTAQEILNIYKATTTAPALLSPVNGSFLMDTNSTTMDWDSTVTALNYRLMISTDSLFISITLDTIITTSFYQDKNLMVYQGSDFFWKVRTINDGGIGPWSEVFKFSTLFTAVEAGRQLPTEYSLMQNFPNPFNPSTVIRYTLPQNAKVSLTVYDILGKQVAELVNGEVGAGYHKVVFDATNLASGIYLYRIIAGSFIQVNKMLLMK